MDKNEVKIEPNEEVKTKKVASKKNDADKTKKSWKEVFVANYNGTSKEAKELEPFLKSTYKGDVYIPWAVMERLTYMCDEDAQFNIIQNENGGFVFTDKVENHQVNIQKDVKISETNAPMFAHFVKVELNFLGKSFLEIYPIQEQDYSAARIFNQNLVNRAIQRAKAKLASRATGLALKLYEGSDLQFDDAKKDNKPAIPEVKNTGVKEEVKVVEQKTTVPIKEEVVVEQNNTVEKEPVKETEPVVEAKNVDNVPQEIIDLISIIKTTEESKIIKVLQKVNLAVMKKYNFALSPNDTERELANKISKFPNVTQFKKTIENFLNETL